MKEACLAALAVALCSAPASAGNLRTCDGRVRHVTCHWSGGDQPSDFDVPPEDHLGYGAPSVTLTDRGRITVVVGSCQISCDAPTPDVPPAADPVSHAVRKRR